MRNSNRYRDKTKNNEENLQWDETEAVRAGTYVGVLLLDYFGRSIHR